MGFWNFKTVKIVMWLWHHWLGMNRSASGSFGMSRQRKSGCYINKVLQDNFMYSFWEILTKNILKSMADTRNFANFKITSTKSDRIFYKLW